MELTFYYAESVNRRAKLIFFIYIYIIDYIYPLIIKCQAMKNKWSQTRG